MASSILTRPLLADTRDETLRSQLRAVTVAWVFGAFWLATITGAALTKFQLALGTPEWAFGALVSLAYAAHIFQVPASLIQSRIGRRKEIFLVSATFGRLMWCVIAAIPWVVPPGSGVAWKLMAVCVLLAAAGNSRSPKSRGIPSRQRSSDRSAARVSPGRPTPATGATGGPSSSTSPAAALNRPLDSSACRVPERGSGTSRAIGRPRSVTSIVSPRSTSRR